MSVRKWLTFMRNQWKWALAFIFQLKAISKAVLRMKSSSCGEGSLEKVSD
jgi:hypothetical protein